MKQVTLLVTCFIVFGRTSHKSLCDCLLRACGALIVIVWKVFARKNLPHDHKTGSLASQAR